MHFRMFGMNGSHAKAKNETFTDVGLTCVRTSKMKISRRHLADYVKKLHQKACCTSNTIFFLHSTNQIIELWRCRCRCCRYFLKFPIHVITQACEMCKNEKLPVQTTVCRCQIVCKILTFLLPSSLWLLKLTGVYGKRLST